jgi:hypothetical protein
VGYLLTLLRGWLQVFTDVQKLRCGIFARTADFVLDEAAARP